jgi:adenylyltransferase/sulfurtransferase
VDHDTVDLSNLQRQILHKEQSVGQLKAESAAASLKQYLWSTIMLSAHD